MADALTSERSDAATRVTTDAPSFIERLRGKRTSDIALPNRTGDVDDRLLADAEDRAWNPLTKMAIRTKRLSQRARRRTRR